MKFKFLIIGLFAILVGCDQPKEMSSTNPVNWQKRMVKRALGDSLEKGKTYLSVYSQIYSLNEGRIQNLTATVSMRNTDNKDSVFVNKAEYFDTKGKLIRNYFDKPIFIAPMETVEIVIDFMDVKGGTGANFLFEWSKETVTNEPLFEAVMISTSGQQGLSFSTKGVKVR
ncbi:DUF3124 domain-containing protein [uncultured Microscilla sp.]|uniref:DUF3124 domain-containing protein n=1 Tax=uncultured Microscilla sp. TaxID=432653 RepID=UPI00261EEBCD|nr:DUF3124 domain-containing protein [uncultured Microscilla sp.]